MSRFLLMQSILGHLDLLAQKHPRKAASQIAKECKRAVKQSLRPATHGSLSAKPLRRAA